MDSLPQEKHVQSVWDSGEKGDFPGPGGRGGDGELGRATFDLVSEETQEGIEWRG